jgi:hypothetical protein
MRMMMRGMSDAVLGLAWFFKSLGVCTLLFLEEGLCDLDA